MTTITHSRRYLPHLLSTKLGAVKLYRSTRDVDFVCRRYHISKASLMRWNKSYDGTTQSLEPKSHRPHSPHPNAHTAQEIKWICDLHRRNPHISVCEMYGKLRSQKAYSRHPGSLYRIYQKLGFSSSAPSTKKKRHNKPYDTPSLPGVKWQMDVKYVPSACYTGPVPDSFFQYTVIDEATRERFIFPYKEQSSYSTIDFLKRAIIFFGYKPHILQTDNGSEFCNTRKTNRIHPLDAFCSRAGIEHKRIRPKTPWHNGKVERSHRNDQERFYNHLKFYSYKDLKNQMYRYMRRTNNIPMAVLCWRSPNEQRRFLSEHS